MEFFLFPYALGWNCVVVFLILLCLRPDDRSDLVGLFLVILGMGVLNTGIQFVLVEYRTTGLALRTIADLLVFQRFVYSSLKRAALGAVGIMVFDLL